MIKHMQHCKIVNNDQKEAPQCEIAKQMINKTLNVAKLQRQVAKHIATIANL